MKRCGDVAVVLLLSLVFSFSAQAAPVIQKGALVFPEWTQTIQTVRTVVTCLNPDDPECTRAEVRQESQPDQRTSQAKYHVLPFFSDMEAAQWLADYQGRTLLWFAGEAARLKKDGFSAEKTDLPLPAGDGGFACTFSFTKGYLFSKQLMMAVRKGPLVLVLPYHSGAFYSDPHNYSRAYLGSGPDEPEEARPGNAQAMRQAFQALEGYLFSTLPEALASLAQAYPLMEKAKAEWRRIGGKDPSAQDLNTLADQILVPLPDKDRSTVAQTAAAKLKHYQESKAPEDRYLSRFRELAGRWQAQSVHETLACPSFAKALKGVATPGDPALNLLSYEDAQAVALYHLLFGLRTRLESGEAISAQAKARLILGLFSRMVWTLELPPFPPGTDSASYMPLLEAQRMVGLAPAFPDAGPGTFIRLDVAADPVPAKAGSPVRIKAVLTEKSGKAVRPVPGKNLKFELVPLDNRVAGQLSASEAITDGAGTAVVTYAAPPREEMPKGAVARAQVRISCADPRVSETLFIDLDNRSGVSVQARHPIFPARQDLENPIVIRFETPEKGDRKSFDVRLSCRSGQGRIGTPGGPGAAEAQISLVSGMDNHLAYRWAGPPAGQTAVEETLAVEIPALGLKGDVSFSVGIDLVLESVRFNARGSFFPGLPMPVAATVADRLHPDADLGALFQDLNIEPGLEIRQKSFAPKAPGSPMGDKFMANLVHHVSGAVMPKGAVARGIAFANVKRNKDGQWQLVNKMAQGMDAVAAITPYDLGHYLFEVSFDPRLAGDGKGTTTLALQMDVSDIPPSEEILFTFMLPTLKAYAAMASGKAEMAWEVANRIHSGQYLDAVKTLGDTYLLSPLNDKIADQVKGSLMPWGKAMMEVLKERMPAQTLDKISAFVGKQTASRDKAWVQEALETLDLDLIGNTVGAMTEALEDAAVDSVKPFWSFLSLPEAQAAPAKTGILDAARFFETLLARQGRYGVLIVTRTGLSDFRATDRSGSAYALASPDRRLFDPVGGKKYCLMWPHVAVIPFRLNAPFRIHLKGDGSHAVQVVKIMPGVTSHGTLNGNGQAWTKTLAVDTTQ